MRTRLKQGWFWGLAVLLLILAFGPVRQTATKPDFRPQSIPTSVPQRPAPTNRVMMASQDTLDG